MAPTTLAPVEHHITGIPRRRLYAWCRAGRIAGAVKIGRRWFVRLDAATEDADIASMLAGLGWIVD